ncbi:MAG: fumarate hydratase, partial [Abditibacteriota bacterium]|nr:fumarate hydratase [Abditibacteriota bacterium]
IAPKGGGSENMSKVAMLKPAQGKKGVVDFVVETVKSAGPNPCPPIIVGVGLGGTMDGAGLLSKKALLREIGSKADNPIDAELEEELFAAINKLGIGPAGYGGDTTALAVFVKSYPCHIASLPVAVTIQCHAARHEVIRWK